MFGLNLSTGDEILSNTLPWLYLLQFTTFDTLGRLALLVRRFGS